jgi:pimeloyl-ACP methyl ester carboxylesterase
LTYWTSPGPGSGPELVFLHGAFMDHREFNAQVPVFAGTHRVLVLDARGHGQSRPGGVKRMSVEDLVDDVIAVLDDAAVRRPVVVGQSLGAYIAQHLARRQANRVHALALVGTTPIFRPARRHEELALRAMTPIFGIWPSRNLARVTADSCARTEDARRYMHTRMSSVTPDDLRAVWPAVGSSVSSRGFDLARDLPVLLTHGQHDNTGTIARDSRYWARQRPEITYQAIPGAGHNANQDNPAFFNHLLKDFLAKDTPHRL